MLGISPPGIPARVSFSNAEASTSWQPGQPAAIYSNYSISASPSSLITLPNMVNEAPDQKPFVLTVYYYNSKNAKKAFVTGMLNPKQCMVSMVLSIVKNHNPLLDLLSLENDDSHDTDITNMDDLIYPYGIFRFHFSI